LPTLLILPTLLLLAILITLMTNIATQPSP
jgi:hypothetical protein